jgi:hypothetical protein
VGGYTLIFRIYTACPGCDAPTILRIGVAVSPGEKQSFAIQCTRCSSTIRGKLITTEDATVSAQLDEAPTLDEDASNEWQVITDHPAFPFAPDTGFSPFLDIMDVLGDAAMPYFQSVGQFNAIITQDWPQLQRAYQFYLAEDWKRFDTAMARLLEENWPDDPSMVMRHDAIHRLLMAIVLPLDPEARYADMRKEIWERAQPSAELVSYIKMNEVQEGLRILQTRVFQQFAHLIEIRQMWMPALPVLWLGVLDRPIPKDWKLAGSDFPILRGAYQQNFELSCQALPLLVVIQNAAEGRLAASMQGGPKAPSWVPVKLSQNPKPPRTLAQFNKANAETKESFLERFPITEENWLDMFDRTIRNAIAHADVDEVAAKGKIVTGKGITLTYLEFVVSVCKQIQLLLLWLNLVKLFRVYNLLAGQKEGSR